MGQNTSQAMGIDVLDTFMHHPGVIPGPGGSKNGCFGGKKQPNLTLEKDKWTTFLFKDLEVPKTDYVYIVWVMVRFWVYLKTWKYQK